MLKDAQMKKVYRNNAFSAWGIKIHIPGMQIHKMFLDDSYGGKNGSKAAADAAMELTDRFLADLGEARHLPPVDERIADLRIEIGVLRAILVDKDAKVESAETRATKKVGKELKILSTKLEEANALIEALKKEVTRKGTSVAQKNLEELLAMERSETDRLRKYMKASAKTTADAPLSAEVKRLAAALRREKASAVEVKAEAEARVNAAEESMESLRRSVSMEARRYNDLTGLLKSNGINVATLTEKKFLPKPPPVLIVGKDTTTGCVKMASDKTSYGAWFKKRTKHFSVSVHGEDGAREKAIAALAAMLEEKN